VSYQISADRGNPDASTPSSSSQNSASVSTAPSWNPKWTTPARLALLKNGYNPTPLAGKRPVLEQWQSLSATVEGIAGWEMSHPNATNTGVLTKSNPAVDIDILDREVGDVIHNWVKELVPPGCPELVRIGLAPKRAILFRCDVPFPKTATGKWLDSQKTEHQVEILCDGQQVVAYGNHPDTGRAYTWSKARPGQTPRMSLPLLTSGAAQKLVDRAKALFQERGWRPKTEERSIMVTATPRAWCPQPGDDERIADALRYINPDDHDTWRDIGMALHDHLGERGRDLWDRWSQGSQKFNLHQQNKSWRCFGRRSGITIATLFHLARLGGWRPSPTEIQRETWRAAGRCIRRETPAVALRLFLEWADYKGVERCTALRIFEAIVDKEIAR